MQRLPRRVTAGQQSPRGLGYDRSVGRIRRYQAGMAGDETGIDAPGHKFRSSRRAGQEGGIGTDWPDFHRTAGGAEFGARLVAAFAMDDQLGDHGIVVRRHRVTLFHAAVHPHVARQPEMLEHAGGRPESSGGVFRIEPCFHRPAPDR